MFNKKVFWSNKFGKDVKGNVGGFLIAGLFRAFTLLICIVNFQEVKISPQLFPRHFLTVESMFMAPFVGLEFYNTGVEVRTF